MSEISSIPGLQDDDSSPIVAVLNAPDANLATLIRVGRLNPKKDFVGGDFRGWPLAGQDVSGIDFTGADLRGTGIEYATHDEHTILTDTRMDDVPPPPPGPIAPIYKGNAQKADAWSNYWHWHAGVHQSFGKKLNLIRLRFITGSIFVKESIIRDLDSSGITDYMIFNLYSQWDISIRAWGDEKSLSKLKQRFAANTEIYGHGTTQFLDIQQISHIPDRGNYSSIEDAKAALIDIPTEHLQDVQEKGKRSSYFRQLSRRGLILANDTRYTNKRIQFYISIRDTDSPRDLLWATVVRVVRESKYINSKSIYLTSSGDPEAVVKGQIDPSRYYDIHNFLRQLTEELERSLRVYIKTETALVANQYHRHLALIDFDKSVRDPNTSISKPANVLVATGENEQKEFKSTLRVNLHTSQKDPRMELEALKTIAAFVNTNGGTLIIGVNNEGKALGLQADQFVSEDRMNLHLVNLIRDKMGAQHMICIRPHFGDFENSRVFIVECDRGPAPAYVKEGGTERFYIRTGAATTELSGSQMHEFIKHRFA